MTIANHTELLRGWLPAQRWFAGSAEELRTEVLAILRGGGGPLVDVVLAFVGSDTYLVPVSSDHHGEPGSPESLIGTYRGRPVYDGLRDPAAASYWLDLLNGRCYAEGLQAEATTDLPRDLPVRPLGAEQSNTSLVFGDELLLKVFRRLTPGVNPDLEVTRRLGELGSPHVAPALGWVEGAGSTLAVLQPFLAGAEEGWALATSSVRDGADFSGEARRLGATTAGLHADLARAFPHRRATPDDLADLVRLLHRRREAAVAETPQLRAYDAGLRSAYDALARDEISDELQRIHGDYHLGQVLRTGDGWVVLDFEGEPARPVEERTALMSPLRDVAGMLRSFDYAGLAGASRNAFLDGYAEESGRDPRRQATLLRAYELDKAVYEVRYEAAYRPDWIGIPLRGIQRLLTGSDRDLAARHG